MKVFAVDDEPMLLENLTEVIKEVLPDADISAFNNPDDTIAALSQIGEIDIAFLDIEIGYMNGVELAKKIKEIHPLCNIVFCTGYGEYMAQAFDLGASDYLSKPITKEKIEHALSMLRHITQIRIPKGGMYVRCFGEFEVFYNGAPLTTLTKRSKELLAYLIDKACAVCSTTDIINTVFYDNSDAYFRISKKDLENALAVIGEESILIKEWGKLGIRKDKIKCDYFEYLDNNPGVMNLYKGAYMLQYAWAKKTMHRLNKQEAVTQ